MLAIGWLFSIYWKTVAVGKRCVKGLQNLFIFEVSVRLPVACCLSSKLFDIIYNIQIS